ncbi:hypothetical protein GCM10025787_20280 [Saccharopolyspora rosea]
MMRVVEVGAGVVGAAAGYEPEPIGTRGRVEAGAARPGIIEVHCGLIRSGFFAVSPTSVRDRGQCGTALESPQCSELDR